MAIVLPSSFYEAAKALLGTLNITPTPTNLNLLAAWSYCEKPHSGSASWQWNNPWNTTLGGYGETGTANNAGVGIYPSRSMGIDANAATLENGLYPRLFQSLKTSNATMFFQSSAEMALWGTSLACIQSIYGQLESPPQGYLKASSPGPTTATSSSTTPLTRTIITNPYAALGGALLLGGLAIGTIEAFTHRAEIREWFERQRNHDTMVAKGD